MPTAKPRITLTLEPRTYEVLSRLSAAGGDSMSQLVASLVDLAVPSMERMVVLLERAKAAPAEARAGFAAAVERADRELIPLLEQVLGQTDLFLADLNEAAAAATAAPSGARRAASRAAEAVPEGGSTPVPVTRGSGGSTGAPARAKGRAAAPGVARPPGRLFSDDEAKAIAARVAGKGSKRG